MKDKDLILQLKKLQQIQPRSDWRKINRDILLSQVIGPDHKTADQNISKWTKFKLPLGRLRYISQPALAVFLIIFIMLGGGILSLQAARDTKPGDSLYIAKIINEKTQLALTFSQKKKMRLGLTFAHNRAKELGQVLAEEETGGQQERVEDLVSRFKEEINLAKSRLERIQAKSYAAFKPEPLPITTKENLVQVEQGDVEDNGDSHIFSANLGRDEKGISVSDQPIADTAGNEPISEEPAEVPTTTAKTIISTSTEEISAVASPQEIVELLEEQVEELLNQDELDQASLTELSETIDQVDIGEVKGDSEAATGTPEFIPEEDAEEGGVLGVEEQASTTDAN